MAGGLDLAARSAAGRVIGALAARFRDLDLAEEAFSDACVAAARAWPEIGEPDDPAAWLYRAAVRKALDEMRRRGVRARLVPEPPPPHPSAEDLLTEDAVLIPDERLRLIFICCHPAIAPESRAALTLRLVCGLTAPEIAAAFLVPVPTLLQRLTRAKRKITDAGVPFAVPGPEAWDERLEAVLTTLEVAYAKAHEDAAGAGAHAGYAEARRPARMDADGAMIPLSEQNPRLWRRPLIEAADRYLHRAGNLGDHGPRALTAAIHGVWCARRSLADPAPWPTVLRLYDALLIERDDVVVRLNRAVALAEVAGPAAALAEIEALRDERMEAFQPWHAVHADLSRRLGRLDDSRAAYDRAIDLAPGPAERAWLTARRP